MAAGAVAAAGSPGVLRLLWSIILNSRNNQFVQLAVVAAIGSVAYKAQQLLRMAWLRFLNTFRCQIRLQNREREIYDAVIAFISRQKMVVRGVRELGKRRRLAPCGLPAPRQNSLTRMRLASQWRPSEVHGKRRTPRRDRRRRRHD